MKKQIQTLLLLVCGITLSLTSCRKDISVIPRQEENVFPPEQVGQTKGMYLLNEGNMNMNKASLDRLDFSSGVYQRNIYNQANPEVVRGLGDVGNDILIYGSKVYVVVNVSNKIEVLDVKTSRKIKQIDLHNCRYITFNDGKVYVSAYLGKVGDANAAQGSVSEIDTTTLQVRRKVTVGRQPEEMAVVGNKLYVANSGGYSPPDYERTISVINLDNFSEEKRIDVAINLHRLKADRYGDLYVSSRGDYFAIPSRLFVIDTHTDQVKNVFDLAVSNFWIDDDSAYIISSSWNQVLQKNSISYSIFDVKDEVLTENKFIRDGTDNEIVVPYGIIVNPETKDVYLSDARDYVSPGRLYCFDPAGRKKWVVTTGDIPAHFAFIN